MSVSLNPSSNLGFRRPLTQLVKRSLTITNHNSQPVAFKVKTTAPKLYCVRPNSGRVEPGESVDVSVMLQAMKEEPALNAKCKDKFLIQSTLITPEKELMSLTDLWASPDLSDESKVHQQKLRVSYLPAEGVPLEEEDETAHQNAGSAYANDASHYGTVKQFPANGHDESHAEHPTHEEEHGDFSVAREESHESPHDVPPVSEPIPQPPSPPLPVFAPMPEPLVPAPVPMPEPVIAHEPIVVARENDATVELLAKYKEAQAEIERLRTTLATMSASPPPELRRRTRAPSDVGSAAETDVQTVVEEAPLHQDGVPLQVVVIIALGVFITTYLFF